MNKGLCLYLGEGLVVRAGKVVLVEVLGVEDNGTLMVGGTRRERQRFLLLLILPLRSGNFRLLRLQKRELMKLWSSLKAHL